ncbi:MAG: transcription antitermination factor NusB [Burkholderiaceae bacterium]
MTTSSVSQPATPPAKGKSRSARRRAREVALQGVYQWLISGHDAAAIEAHATENEQLGGADLAHYRELLSGAIDQAQDLRARFAPHLDRQPEVLSPVEHAILLIATYELQHRVEIPYRVVINEAVELAKSFGGTDGFRYVNGVLDKVAAQLRPSEAARVDSRT